MMCVYKICVRRGQESIYTFAFLFLWSKIRKKRKKRKRKRKRKSANTCTFLFFLTFRFASFLFRSAFRQSTITHHRRSTSVSGAFSPSLQSAFRRSNDLLLHYRSQTQIFRLAKDTLCAKKFELYSQATLLREGVEVVLFLTRTHATILFSRQVSRLLHAQRRIAP